MKLSFNLLSAIMLLALLSPLASATAATTVSISNENLSVRLDLLGAQLRSIHHPATDVEYLWQGHPDYWIQRAPNMFPVCVRFKDDRFTYRGDEYTMPFLGLAHTADFATTTLARHRVVQTMESTPATREYYPFDFKINIVSELDGLTLTQRYEVTNTGDNTLYFALGGHPGFNTPITNGRTRDDYDLVFSKRLTTTRPWVIDGLIQTDLTAFLNNEDRLSIGDPRVPPSGMFLRDHASRQIGIGRTGRPPYVTVDLGDFPNTNIWTPPGMPYACIEPMLGHHDLQETPEAIEDKSFLISLPADQTHTYTYTITINPNEGAAALRSAE
ncbi:MAG: hypothetical protein QNL51_02035 [Opitutaceae bacterium]